MTNFGHKEPGVDDFRKDLIHQLNTADDIDWDYFVETAQRAKAEANLAGVNMSDRNK